MLRVISGFLAMVIVVTMVSNCYAELDASERERICTEKFVDTRTPEELQAVLWEKLRHPERQLTRIGMNKDFICSKKMMQVLEQSLQQK